MNKQSKQVLMRMSLKITMTLQMTVIVILKAVKMGFIMSQEVHTIVGQQML